MRCIVLMTVLALFGIAVLFQHGYPLCVRTQSLSISQNPELILVTFP